MSWASNGMDLWGWETPLGYRCEAQGPEWPACPRVLRCWFPFSEGRRKSNPLQAEVTKVTRFPGPEGGIAFHNASLPVMTPRPQLGILREPLLSCNVSKIPTWNIYLYFICSGVVPMCVSVHRGFMEPRRWPQIFQGWIYRWMWATM